MNVRVIAAMTGAFTLAILAACSVETTSTPGSSTTSTTSSSGNAVESPISTEACKERCTTKISQCGAPAGQAEQGCTQLCDGTITEDQASCLEAKDCEDIAKAESVDELCPKAPSSSSGSSSSGSDDLPTAVTVTGTIPSSTKATHVLDEDSSPPKIISLVSVAPEPTISPTLPPGVLPNVADDNIDVTIEEPDPGECELSVSFVLNPAQIGVQATGVDEGAANDCARFTDEVAKGRFKATLKNVPYTGGLSSGKATVAIHLN